MSLKTKIIILYESFFYHNTENIAHILAQRLRADLYRLEQIENIKLLDYDVIAVGTDIYFESHHSKIKLFLKNLPIFNGQKSFFFLTGRIVQKKYLQSIVEKLSTAMTEKNLEVMGYLAIKRRDTIGPLALIGDKKKRYHNLSDFYNVELFANNILNKL